MVEAGREGTPPDGDTLINSLLKNLYTAGGVFFVSYTYMLLKYK